MDDARVQALDFYVNQYVIVAGEPKRFDGRQLIDVRSKPIKDFEPMNVEQRCLFDLLGNDDIQAKFVRGVAGSGKTKCVMQFGLSKVLDGKRFDRYLVVRNPVPVGPQIGYLKGDLGAKLAPWQNAIVDNLPNGRKDFDYLVSKGALEWDIPALMQGRDLRRTFIHVTEAQMLTFEQLQMLGSRASHGAVIVFEGDEKQVLNDAYVANNGLRDIVGKLVGNPEIGYMRLTKTVRSRVAELFAGLSK
jgi:predicted ribonuclease YlaK